MTVRWGITVPLEGLPLPAHEAFYREAEDLGYTDFWSSEADQDPLVPLAFAAAWTKRATLGTAIVGAFGRGPAIMAMGAAALAEAAPGRFVLGIGAGSSINVERWNGLKFERPLKRVEEVAAVCRQALDGQQANLQGETLTVSGFRLGRPPAQRVPIYIAALREKMVRLAARESDGVIINWLSAEDAGKVVQIVRDEARKAGKDPDSVDVVARLFVCVTDDPEGARERFRRAITGYLNVPVYRKFHQWLGRGGELQPMNELWDSGDRKGALAAVPGSAIGDLAVIGTADECRAHILRYYENGVNVTFPSFAMMNPGQDDESRAKAAWEMMRALTPPA
jgi:probable F420-dependent oxidoreductase